MHRWQILYPLTHALPHVYKYTYGPRAPENQPQKSATDEQTVPTISRGETDTRRQDQPRKNSGNARNPPWTETSENGGISREMAEMRRRRPRKTAEMSREQTDS